MAQFKFMGATSAAHKRNVPYGTIVGHLQQDPRDSGRYVPLVSIQDFASSVVNVRADTSGIYQNTACVDLGVLFRPFSCASGMWDYDGKYISYLPHFESPFSFFPSGGTPLSGIYTPPAMTNNVLNPYKNNNSYEWTTYGLDYSGIHLRKNPDHDLSTARGIYFNTPMVVGGYGYDIFNIPVPNIHADYDPTPNQSPAGYEADPLFGSGEFRADYLTNLHRHKVGTFDIKWNPYLKTWCSPGMVLDAKLQEPLSYGYAGAASGAIATLWTWDDNFNEVDFGRIRVFNSFGTAIAANTKIIVGYNPMKSKWIVISANCI